MTIPGYNRLRWPTRRITKSAASAKLSISFSSPMWRILALLQSVLAVFVLGSLASAVWIWLEADRLNALTRLQEQALLRQQTAEERQGRDPIDSAPQLTEAQIAQIRQAIRFAEHLAEKRQFSWTELLDNLDKGVPANVSISSVRMNFQDSSITLNGMVASLNDMMHLAQQLESRTVFQKVQVVQHMAQTNTRTDAGTGPSPISFILTAHYRPAH